MDWDRRYPFSVRKDCLGLARHDSFNSWSRIRLTISQSAYAGQLLFIACSGLAKCSTLWLMMRLFNLNGPKSQKHGKAKLHLMVCLGVIGVVAIWAVGSMIGVGADCSSTDFIKTPSLAQCPQQVRIISGMTFRVADDGSIHDGKSSLQSISLQRRSWS